MKQIVKYMFLMIVGGSIYYLIETAWRGHSHWSMIAVGGICFCLCGALNEWFTFDIPLIAQMLTCGVMITAVEFLAGLILNVWLGLVVWDYSSMPLNVMGQVCLPFTLLWCLLSAVAIIIDDYLRYFLFGEEKPHYTIW